MSDEAVGAALGRRPTMADVAARAGVSRALVSTVFRDVPGAGEQTRQRVLDAAAELGYRMDNRARLLRRARTQLLGVMFQVQDAFQADLVEALYPAAEAAGYDLMLSAVTPDRSETRAVDALVDNRCEALLLVSPQVPDAQLSVLASRSPTVVMARSTHIQGVDVVRTADLAVVEQALDHLLALGHRDIAHVDGTRFRGASDRRRNYRTLMRRHGLAAHTRIIPGGMTEVDGIRAADELLRQGNLPTGVVAFNDRVAVGVMFGLRRAGISVPEHVSIVGYDDVHMAALPHIDLTTVGQDVRQTAQHAVRRAVARLDQHDTAGHDVLVQPYVAIRGTTGPVATDLGGGQA